MSSDLARQLEPRVPLLEEAATRSNALRIAVVAFASDSAVAFLSLELVEVEVARASPNKDLASEIDLAIAILYLPPVAFKPEQAAALSNAAIALDIDCCCVSVGVNLSVGAAVSVGVAVNVELEKVTIEARVKAATLWKCALIIFLALES
jgi:hypothetical protein